MNEINEPTERKSFIWVKDNDGNTWICPKETLKDPKNMTEDELKECVDESSILGEGG